MMLSEAVEAFLLSCDGCKAPATLTWYEQRLRSLLTFLGEDACLESVTISDLRRFRSSLAGKGSVWTLHGSCRAVRRFFRWLCDEGRLSHNPALRLELPRLPKGRARGIEHGDLRKMLSAAADLGARELALCWFFYSTGARRGGVVGLRLSDLHLEHRYALVCEKNAKTRMVPLIAEAVAALRAWLSVRPKVADEHVFIGRRGLPLSGNGVYKVLRRVAEAAGVDGQWNPHSFRHRRARDWLAAGVPLSIVSQGLGHSTLSVTADIYGVQPGEVVNQMLLQPPLPFTVK